MIEIIMAAYNGRKYLEEQLNSIFRNTCEDWRLLVRDDCSSDGTKELVKEWEQRFPGRIRLCANETNKRACRNFLEGAAASEEAYVMFSDQDDVWDADKIAVTFKKMRELEGEGGSSVPCAVFTDVRVVDEGLNLLSKSFFNSSHINPHYTDLNHLLMENKLIGCTVMMNRALVGYLRQTPDWKRVKMHDWWTALIAASFGKIGFVDRATSSYRQHGGNVIGSKSFFRYVKKAVFSLPEQKRAIRENMLQAEEFLRVFEKQLPPEKDKIVRAFAGMRRQSFLQRREALFCGHFYKTNMLKNFALWLLL